MVHVNMVVVTIIIPVIVAVLLRRLAVAG